MIPARSCTRRARPAVREGALHSYKSLMSASSAFSRQDQLGHKDHMASFLPPAWINEQWLIFGCNLLSGGTVDFAENSETQQADVRETAPTLIVYSSKLWESLAGQVRARLRNASRVKRLTSNALMPSAFKLAGLLEIGAEAGSRSSGPRCAQQSAGPPPGERQSGTVPGACLLLLGLDAVA